MIRNRGTCTFAQFTAHLTRFVGFTVKKLQCLTYALFAIQSPPKFDSPLFELIEAETKDEEINPGLQDLQTNIF